MKAKVFFLSVGFSLCLFSCSNDSNEDGTKNENNTSDVLYAIATMTENLVEIPQDKKPNPGEPGVVIPQLPIEIGDLEELAFTGDDIKSFNVTTGEMIFSDLVFKKLVSTKFYASLTLYINDKPILKSIPVTNESSSNPYRDQLVFYMKLSDSTFYLSYLQADDKPNTEWDKNLVKYFRETGKIAK